MTISDASDLLDRMERILDSVMDEAAIQYFTGEDSVLIARAGERMLEIGPLLYDNPHLFIRTCLFEQLDEIHPEIRSDVEYDSFIREEVRRIAIDTTEQTTWEESTQRVQEASGIPA